MGSYAVRLQKITTVPFALMLNTVTDKKHKKITLSGVIFLIYILNYSAASAEVSSAAVVSSSAAVVSSSWS